MFCFNFVLTDKIDHLTVCFTKNYKLYHGFLLLIKYIQLLLLILLHSFGESHKAINKLLLILSSEASRTSSLCISIALSKHDKKK